MTMEERIARLERQVHRQRGVLVLAGLVVAGITLVGMVRKEVPEVIRAKRFEVPGMEGTAAYLSAGDDGGILSIANTRATPVFEATACRTGGLLSIHDPDGDPVVGIAGGDKGGAVCVYDNDGTLLSAILTSENGGNITIFNRNLKPVCTIEVDEHGNGQIGAWNGKGDGKTLKPGP